MNKKPIRKAAVVAQLTQQAIRLSGDVTPVQRRILKVCAERGRDMEPTGLLAGVPAA